MDGAADADRCLRHLAQMVLDAVHNAEHASPGVPGHHLSDADLAALHRDPADT